MNRVQKSAAQYINYMFDAAGTKLRSILVNGTGRDTVHYISGVQYRGSKLDFVPTAEGRVVRDPVAGTWKYEYHIKDHLGNLRVAFQDFQGDDVADVVQRNTYYPFGSSIAALDFSGGGEPYKYQFGGKEKQTELGLNFYDFAGRDYSPVGIPRFFQVDPLADKMRRWSPYSYAFSNPLRFIDPDGLMPVDDYYHWLTGKYLGSDGAATNNIRTIDPEKFNNISSSNEGTTSAAATVELQDNSYLVKEETSTIESGVQAVHDLTLETGVEHTMYLVLDVSDFENPILTARPGPVGDDKESPIFASTGSESSFVGSGQILVGQVHGHPRTQEKGKVNAPGTSQQDKETAAKLKTTIYATESWRGEQGTAANVYRVTSSGNQNNQRPVNTTNNGAAIARDALERTGGKVK